MNEDFPFVLPLACSDASLGKVGGKGRALAMLAFAHYPVPPGFLVSTAAYRCHVESNQLQESILESVNAVIPRDADSAQSAAEPIRRMFESSVVPAGIMEAIAPAYSALGDNDVAVSVRSSATAEDLPDLSFAGQHATALNVCGQEDLWRAIRDCWASLWTARAISYRIQMEIDSRAVAMGVVVQSMVEADVSGVLFTANPLSGERDELVINSSFGLGEAIVRGDVTPDTFVLYRANLQVKEQVIGEKETEYVSDGVHGIASQSVPAEEREQASLSDDLLSELGSLSLSVERLFGGLPQDIEWAVAGDRCWLLQSRPITNLPPAPLCDVRWEPPAQGEKLIRRQVVENMPEPLSPLFEELYLKVGLEESTDLWMAKIKIPFKIEDFIQRPMFLTVNGYAYCRASYRTTWRLLWVMPAILCWYLLSLPRLLRNIVPDWHDSALPEYLALVESWKKLDPATATDQDLLRGLRELTIADAVYWFGVAMVLGAAKITDDLLDYFLQSRFVKGELTSGMFLRGFPSKTMEAQDRLEAIARKVRESDSLRELVTLTPVQDLLADLKGHSCGKQIADDLDEYLCQYGHQIYSLDYVRPTQIEDPTPVLLSLQALVSGEEYDTQQRQARMAQERRKLEKQTLESLGLLRRWLFRTLLGWAQKFGPHREQALFYMGAAWPTLRRMALELGGRLVAAETLATPADVFFLDSQELKEACVACRRGDQARSDFGQTAIGRRELREARKRLHPPGMIPEKSKFTFGPFDFSSFETQKRNTDDSETLEGFAVSPGNVTGRASVILSADDFTKMTPNTILVCPTTTPAWTPLFAQASGLVTDIGGVLAHGSIVAREYGIPAVMGTGNGTQRISTGQRIRIDGNSGTVTILK